MTREARPKLSLDPDCLEALEAFAESMNLTLAAKRLHRAQPTVHAQLRRLADAVGAPLYLREGRGLALTDAGVEVLAFARESRARLAALEATLARRARERPIVLATGEGALLYLLGPALATFHRRHPRSITILLRDRAATLRAVRTAEADLGVTALDGESLDGLQHERIATVRSAVVIERALPLAKHRSITWAQLEHLPLILPPKGSTLRAAAERALGPKLTVAVETRSWPVAMRCAQLRLGAAIVNDFCTPPKGCVLRPLRQGPSVHYSLLTRDGSTLLAPADALRKAIASLRCDPKVTL